MENTVTFSNKSNLTLTGVVATPEIQSEIPLVILCHGFGSGKNSKTNRLLAQKLNEQNIASFRFDFKGHYDSEGDISNVTISSGVEDLVAAIQFLKTCECVGFSKLALVGSSYGGNVALWYAAYHDDIRALVLKSPVSDYCKVRESQLGETGICEWQKKGFALIEGGGEQVKTNYEFYNDAKSKNTYELARNIKIPTLIFHGDKDDNVPIVQSIELAKVLGGYTHLEIVKGANHGYKEPEQIDFVIHQSVHFLKKYLVG